MSKLDNLMDAVQSWRII